MARRSSRTVGALPAEVSTLVGRQAEALDIRHALARARLVTLTGPGGVGKTRLALHVARTTRSAFPDGAWLVALAELSQPDLIVSTIMTRLGSAGTDLRELVDLLGDQQLLLVLDNCEHLAEGVARVAAEVLLDCPNVRILATSRAALRVEGEALYRVPPLSIPAAGGDASGRAASTYDAVALFLERAAARNPDFDADRVDERVVVDLCRRLDGLPLAIELAASSTRWLPIEALLARADDRLVPVGETSRSAPGRHQSLRASLDYSFDLCSPAARTLWARLSVFRGGATLPAIEAVCGGGELTGLEVGPAVFELVDKSIVRFDGSRYQMLETIRQYGEELLRASGGADLVAEEHLAYFVALADDLYWDWFGPKQAALSAGLLEEQANVRAALAFCLEHPSRHQVGMRMASSLWGFWIGSGMPSEGRHWLSRLLADDAPPNPERATALWVHGFLSVVDGDIPGGRRTLATCLQVAEGVDAGSVAHATNALGMADLFEGHVDGAIRLLSEGVRLERKLDASSPYLVDALTNLGLAYCYRGELDSAVEVLEQSRALSAARGEELLHSWTLVFLGLARLLAGRHRDALALVRDGLLRKRAIDNQQGMSWAGDIFAWALLETGDPARAATLLGACEVRSVEFGPLFHGFPGMQEWHLDYVRRAREALGDAAFDRAFAAGRALSLDAMLALALDEQPVDGQPVEEHPLRADADLLGALTRREREIATLVASGKTNREIAAELVIAPRTVDTHVQNILTKLDFTSRQQVVALVAERRASSV